MPVRISMIDPRRLLGELPYRLKYSVQALQPPRDALGEWPRTCASVWRKLNAIGIEKIAAQLAAISEAEGGKPLALCCFEAVATRGHQCHRVIVSVWWLEQTGWELEEITNDGEVLALRQLHRQVRPVLPEGAL